MISVSCWCIIATARKTRFLWARCCRGRVYQVQGQGGRVLPHLRYHFIGSHSLVVLYHSTIQKNMFGKTSFCTPPKKKVDLFFLTHFPSSIYFISYITVSIMVRSQQTQTNIFKQASAGNGTRITSSPVSRQQLSHYTTQDELKAVGLLFDNIKNSAISVVAGAIYMRSLASSRCYIWFTDGINRYQCNVNGRWITSITL